MTYYEKIVCTSKKQFIIAAPHTFYDDTSDVFCDDGVALNTSGEGEGEGRANISESWWKVNGRVSKLRLAGFIAVTCLVFGNDNAPL